MSEKLTQEMSAEDIQIFEEFMKWRAENHPVTIGHKRMELSELNKIVESSFLKMDELNNYQGEYMSFMCGIELGMRLILGDG